MNDKQRRFVSQMRRVHRTDDRHVIDVFGGMRKKLGDFNAGAAMLRKLERRRHETARLSDSSDFGSKVASGRLAGVFLESGLIVKQVNVARTTVHEELNNRFRLVRVMARLWLQIISGRPG